MPLKVLILTVLLVLSTAEKECNEERGGECMGILLNSLFGDGTEEQMCNDMIETVACLRSFVDDCAEDERDPEIDEGLAQLDTLLKDNCGAEEDEPENYSACMHENREYMYGCIGVMAAESLTLYGTSETEEEASDEIKCSMYQRLEQCLTDRAAEKCGEEAGKKAAQDLKSLELPWIPKCEERDLFTFVENELLERKRRK